MNNLISDDAWADAAAELKAAMYAKMKEIGDNFECNSYYEKNWIEDRLIKRTVTIQHNEVP